MLRFTGLAVPPNLAPPSDIPGNRPTERVTDAGRILVIDDDQRMCETLATALTRRGFSVEWRTVGRDAVELLKGHDFDVVLTDLNMDGLDGLAVCQQVAAHHPGLPVVVLTAFGTAESETAVRLAGAWGFLTKPFDLELLRTTLSGAVQYWRSVPH